MTIASTLGRPTPTIAPAKPSLSLSVVIVSWNTRELLAQCLASVFECLHASAAPRVDAALGADPFEVLVVDNASADGSAAMVRDRFPGVRLVENPDNVGFARANNQAMARAMGRYLLMLNPDTVVQRGALQTLLQFMQQHPEAGAAGAQLVNPDGTPQASCFMAPTLPREFCGLFHLHRLLPHGDYRPADSAAMRRMRVEVVHGACVMLSRRALDEVGLLDEDYFIYSEEVDLCTRLRRHGWNVWWVPDVQVVHYGGESTRQMAAAMFVRLYEGKVLYFRKHHGQFVARLYKCILLGAALSRLLICPLAWLERREQRRQHLVLVKHYWRLLAALPGL